MALMSKEYYPPKNVVSLEKSWLTNINNFMGIPEYPNNTFDTLTGSR
jgi:hypothetical protein